MANFIGPSLTRSGNAIWHVGNDGSGSGLDADLLDGFDSAAFARIAVSNNFAAAQIFSSGAGTISAGNFVIGAGGGSPNAVTMAWGDNTGWTLRMGTNVSSVFTTRFTFTDTGNLTMTGNLSVTGTTSFTGAVTLPAGSYATPSFTLGTAYAAGSAATLVRSDATLAIFDATSPSTQAFGDSAVVGSIAFAARRDHKHTMPATPVTSAVAGTNISVSSATGAVTFGITGVIGIANGGTGSGTQNFVDLTNTQNVGGAKTFTVATTFSSTVSAPYLYSYITPAPTNLALNIPSGSTGTVPAYAPMSRFIWHDHLAFNSWWGTPVFETYTGSWAADTLNSDLFNQKENQSVTVIDGTTKTAARWTWQGGNVAYSYIEWWLIAVTYTGTASTKNFLIESSLDGSAWTTRHTSTGNTANAQPVFLSAPMVTDHGYVRLTITVTNGQPLALSSIRSLTNRWGNQGGGAEYSLPYTWDKDRHIGIAAGDAALSTAMLYVKAGSAATSGLFVRGAGSQSANLQEWQNSAGTALSYITSAGEFIYNQDGEAIKVNHAGVQAVFIVNANTSPKVQISPAVATHVGLLVKGFTSQSANLQEWQNSAGVALAKISASGGFQFWDGTYPGLQYVNTAIYPYLTLNTGWQEVFRVGGSGGGNPYGTFLSPNDAARTPLVIRGFASQTANLQQWQNSAGTVLSAIRSDGAMESPYIIAVGGTGGFLTLSSGTIAARTTSAALHVFTVKGEASQTGDLAQFQNSAGTVLSKVTATGQFRNDNSPGGDSMATAHFISSTGSVTGLFSARAGDICMGGFTNHPVYIQQNNAGRISILASTISFGTTGSLSAEYGFLNRSNIVGVVMRGAASQTADLQQWQNSAGTVLVSISASGALAGTSATFSGIVKGAGTDSGRAFDVGNDIQLWDVDEANTLGLRGSQDATTASVRFGSTGPLLAKASSTTLSIAGQVVVVNNDSRLTDARTPSNDTDIVHKSGTETITGTKTFSDLYSNYITSGTSNLYTGQWTKFCTVSLPSQYSDAQSEVFFLQRGDGSTTESFATIVLRVKQQNAFGANPFLDIAVINVNGEDVKPDDFVGIVTSNAGPTTVDFYMRIIGSYRQYSFFPRSGVSSGSFSWLSSQVFSVSLPGGTQAVGHPLTRNIMGAGTGSSTANLLVGASGAAIRPLVVQGAVSQTANLQEWQNSASTVVANVSSVGQVFSTNGFYSPAGTNHFGTGSIFNATLNVSPLVTNWIGIVTRGLAGQTANLQEWQNSAGGVLASINASGVGAFAGSSTVGGQVIVVTNDSRLSDSRTPTGAASGALAGTYPSPTITDAAHSLFWRDTQSHGTYSDFNAPTDHGPRYIQGTTNGPGISGATQYYNFGLGLGSQYAYGSYVMQWAVPRTPLGGNPYLSFRFREAATWGSWQKVYAGYADTAGTATPSNDSNIVHISGTETVTGQKTLSAKALFKNVTESILIGDTGVPGPYYLSFIHAGSGASNISGLRFGSSATGSNDFEFVYDAGTLRLGILSATNSSVVRGAASQSADLQQWQNSAGSVLAYINASGVGAFAAASTVGGQAIVVTNDSRLSDARTPSNNADIVHISGTETITGVKTFSASSNRFTGAGTAYSGASLEVFQSGSSIKPRISFHMGGVVAAQIGMNLNGQFEFLDNPGTGYAPMRAATIEGTTGIFSATTSQAFTVSGANAKFNINTTSGFVETVNGAYLRGYSDNYVTLKYQIESATGNISGIGSDHKFGAGALGGTGSFIHLGSLGDANNTYILSSGSGTNLGLKLRAKGNGYISLQSEAGADLLTVTSVGVVTTAGNLGVGVSPSSTIHGKGAVWSPLGAYRGSLVLHSTNAFAAGMGAGVILGGVYTGTSVTEFAQIVGAKQNATDGNYNGELQFFTRAHGADLIKRMTIDGVGLTTFMGTTQWGTATGKILIEPGTGSNAGYISWYKPSGGARMAYMGYDATNLTLNLESSTTLVLTQGTAGSVGQIIRGAASQTANLQEWQNSGSAIVAKVESSGNLTANTLTSSNGLTVSGNTANSSIGAAIGGVIFAITTGAASSIPLVAKGASSQTASLQEWQNSAGTVLSRVNAAGAFAAPDGLQATPGLTFHSDTATGLFRNTSGSVSIQVSVSNTQVAIFSANTISMIKQVNFFDGVAPTKTGATAQTRYVGGTSSGAPASGTHLAGDWIVATNGAMFICTSGGAPGTWVAVGAVEDDDMYWMTVGV